MKRGSDGTRVNDVDDNKNNRTNGTDRIWNDMRFFILNTSHMQPRFNGVATAGNDGMCEGHFDDRDRKADVRTPDAVRADNETALQLHQHQQVGGLQHQRQHPAHAAVAIMIDDVTNFLTRTAAGAAVFLALRVQPAACTPDRLSISFPCRNKHVFIYIAFLLFLVMLVDLPSG